MTDITTATRDEISTAWPAVSYNGNSDFFDNYINIIDQIQTKVDCDSQECYLGYLPSSDTFIMGFDTWPECDDECDDYGDGDNNLFMFKMNGNLAVDVRALGSVNSMFYSGCYKDIHKHYSDLIDLRLD